MPRLIRQISRDVNSKLRCKGYRTPHMEGTRVMSCTRCTKTDGVKAVVQA